MMPCSVSRSAPPTRICPSTSATARRSFRSHGSSTRPSPGEMSVALRLPGIRPSSTKCTSRASRNSTNACPRTCVATLPRNIASGLPSVVMEMIKQGHAAGLEVILDVVYYHTAEGNEDGPTLCHKGIDNASYYRLLPDKPRYYINDTG